MFLAKTFGGFGGSTAGSPIKIGIVVMVSLQSPSQTQWAQTSLFTNSFTPTDPIVTSLGKSGIISAFCTSPELTPISFAGGDLFAAFQNCSCLQHPPLTLSIRKEKRKEREICSFPELQLPVSYIATEAKCQCAKKVFSFQVALHFLLVWGKSHKLQLSCILQNIPTNQGCILPWKGQATINW